MKNIKILFILGCCFLLSINFFTPLLGNDVQFFTIGIVNFLLGYYLLDINPFKKLGWILIFVYFFLINFTTLYSFIVGFYGYKGVLINIIYDLSSLFAIIVYKSKRKLRASILYFIIYLIISINYYNLNNLYVRLLENKSISGSIIPLIKVYDNNNKSFVLKANGKVQVVDLWSNSCGYCIRSFPKFQELKDYYENDPSVEIFAVNVDEDLPNRKRGNNYLKKYSFKNYFADKTILKKLNFYKFPNYMIIGKDGTIKYFGDLNTGRLETYNNIYRLIENEK